MYLDYLNSDVNRIEVYAVDITDDIHNDVLKYQDSRYPSERHYKDFLKNNERYNLVFFDIFNQKLTEEDNITLIDIEKKYSRFIKYRIDNLHLLYGQSGTIDNLSYDENIDFNNSDELTKLLKQLFIVPKYYNRCTCNFILNDGSIIEVPDINCVDDISNNVRNLSINDILSSGAIYTNINSIILSDVPNDKQKKYVDKWLSYNLSSFRLSFYKNNNFYSNTITNVNKIVDVYKIAKSFYNDSLYEMFELTDFNRSSINHIFMKHLLGSDYNYLNENINYRKKKIYTELNDLITTLAHFIYDRLNTDEHTYYIHTGYSYNYVYSKDGNPIINSDKTEKHKNESGWHPIYIQFAKLKECDMKYGMYCIRHIDNRPYSLLSEKEFAFYSTDPILINVNVDDYHSISEIKETLRHEFTHVIQRWGKVSMDIVKTKKGSLSIIKNVFNNIDDIFPDIQQFCYMFDQYEEGAFINELWTHIEENISKYTVDNTTEDSLFRTILINTNNIHQVAFFDFYINKIRNLDLTNRTDVKFLLVLAYYLNQHKYHEFYCPQIKFDFIQSFIDGNCEIKPNKINWIRNGLTKYITEYYNAYKEDVFDNIHAAIKTIKG